MNNSKIAGLLLAASTLGLHGCAHSALDQKVDREVAEESTITTRTQLRAETGRLIESTPGLSTDQRVQLSALRDTTRTQVDSLWEQSLKLRSVLLKDLLASEYNEDEVELIEQRIKDTENKRLAVIFDAVKKANTILGHNAAVNKGVIEDILEDGRGGRV